MDILNLILKVEEKNPLDISDLKQCDPYSSFGVFCNANSFIEGIIIIIGVALMFGASMWFVKKNQENVQRGKKNDKSNAQ